MKTHGEVVRIPTNRIRPFPGQPREYFDPADMASLEASINQRGQIQPGLIKELEGQDVDFELVDGQRRWTACAHLGVPFCAVIVEPENEAEQFEISLTANFQSSAHTPMEIAKACKRLWESGRSESYIGNLFGKSAFWVSGKLHLNDLIPELQDLLDPRKCQNRDNLLPNGLAENLGRLSPVEQQIRFKEIQKHGYRSIDKAALHHELKKSGEIRSRATAPSEHARLVESFLARIIDQAPKLYRRLTENDDLAAAVTGLGKLPNIHEQLRLAQKHLFDLNVLVETWINDHPAPESKTENGKRNFYSVATAAKEVGVSLRHFRRLAEDFEPIEIGRGFFYRPQDVEKIKLLRFEMEESA